MNHLSKVIFIIFLYDIVKIEAYLQNYYEIKQFEIYIRFEKHRLIPK